MDTINLNTIIKDFVKISKPVVCVNCGEHTKLIGETLPNGGWGCPFCAAYYTYADHPEVKVDVPFIKLTDQLETKQESILLGDPPTATFPMDMVTGFLVPSYSTPYKIKRKKRVLLAEAIDFTRFGRIKSGLKWAFDLTWNDRPRDEYEVLIAFADTQGFQLPFNYTCPFRGSSHICYFDSDVSDGDVASFDDISFSVRITE
jgi:hypothetical protein